MTRPTLNQYQYADTGFNLPPYILEYDLNPNEVEYYNGCIPPGTASITPAIFAALVASGEIYKVATKCISGDYEYIVYA